MRLAINRIRVHFSVACAEEIILTGLQDYIGQSDYFAISCDWLPGRYIMFLEEFAPVHRYGCVSDIDITAPENYSACRCMLATVMNCAGHILIYSM